MDVPMYRGEKNRVLPSFSWSRLPTKYKELWYVYNFTIKCKIVNYYDALLIFSLFRLLEVKTLYLESSPLQHYLGMK